MHTLKDFFDKDFLLQELNDCEGLVDIVDKEGYIETYDTEEDMKLFFHYKPNFETLFSFGSFEVDKEKFFSILENKLDKILFLMPQKIYFVSTNEELDTLLEMEEYRSQYMDFEDALGINWIFNSTIIINVHACKKVSENVFAIIPEKSYAEIFAECIWTTLIHELRHTICDLGLIIPESLISYSEGSEEAVEAYANHCFKEAILTTDYNCFGKQKRG